MMHTNAKVSMVISKRCSLSPCASDRPSHATDPLGGIKSLVVGKVGGIDRKAVSAKEGTRRGKKFYFFSIFLVTSSQFHQHFTNIFDANILSPKRYKCKLKIERKAAQNPFK
jgi:hypothetical protein